MQDINLNKASTDERIDPATEDLQRELLTEFAKNSSHATNDLKFQSLTIGAANTAHIPEIAHGCKKVKILTVTADQVYIDDVNGDVTQKRVLLQEDIWLELNINNIGNLRFLGTSGGEVIYLISSN